MLFAYGYAQIKAALATSQRIHTQTKDGKPTVKRISTALSYRFVRDDKGWRIFVSVEVRPVEQVSRQELGAIGVDLNADHLAVAETDRFGNLIGTRRIDLITYGKTQDQAKALIGDAAVALAAQAQAAGKPIVLETLNFQKKKAELETTDPKQARLLSSFACNKVASSIKAAAFRAGVEIIEVNPAYTSVIGAVNYAQAKGISVHQGAAYAIARRGLGLSERLTVQMGLVPARNGGHVTFDLPARNRSKHVWSFWSKVRTKLKAAHVAPGRCGAHKTAPPPLPLASPGVCPIWNSTARSRGANRSQNCSGNVWPDVPF
ncbi:MAG: IS200/IS605 family accessory protein TnpB-related protein [Rhodoferax sp.]|nr:IS200/IS605 family accessory protein TnpB-related protein [Rhodoferax sp.]